MAIYTVGNHFEKLLREAVLERLNDRKEAMASGVITSYEEYKYQAGAIQSLKDVLDICDDVASTVSELLK